MTFDNIAFMLKFNTLSDEDRDKVLRLSEQAVAYQDMIDRQICVIDKFKNDHPEATTEHPRLWGMYDTLEGYKNGMSYILKDIEKIVNGD